MTAVLLPLKYLRNNIDRMICNWTGHGQSKTGVSKVQGQHLSYDTTNNVWKTTPSNIPFFDPINDCNFDKSLYSLKTFGGLGASLTNNLESISNYLSKYGPQLTKPSPTL